MLLERENCGEHHNPLAMCSLFLQPSRKHNGNIDLPCMYNYHDNETLMQFNIVTLNY